jgi:hypothetical protein
MGADMFPALRDAIYLAHVEAIGAPWLTADARILRRLGKDERVRPLTRS